MRPPLPVLALTFVVSLAGATAAAALEARLVDRRSGEPIRAAAVSILGLSGAATTDADGRFTWSPTPQPPFEVLVVLDGGRVLRPVLVERLSGGGLLELTVEPLFEEELVVAAPVAPNIAAMPASATTLLGRREVELRAPGNLAQVLELVPGVSAVSEGQASRCLLVRGLARGRTLILVDGARVTVRASRLVPARPFSTRSSSTPSKSPGGRGRWRTGPMPLAASSWPRRDA